MTEIDEKQAIELFIHGAKKFMDAARRLEKIEKNHGWGKVAKNMQALLENSRKLFSMKAQTRLETLIMANHVAADSTETKH